MQVFLVTQNARYSIFKYFFKRIEIKEDKIILNCNIDKMKLKKKIKLVKKIAQFLKKNKSNTVILSNKLKTDGILKDLLNSNQIDIITGKKLFKALIGEFLDNVTLENKIKKENTQVAILTNLINDWEHNLIIKLAKKYKSVKVISNNIAYFKKLEEKLFEEEGIIITVTNNKRKALLKSNIIINIDFPEELINKYSIYEKSIIINLEEKIKIHKKRFQGKIINDYKIKLKDESNIYLELSQEEYKDFDLKDLAECYVTNKTEEIKNIEIY